MDGLDPEFGSNAGNKAFIVSALYGLKSAGVLFCSHLANFMQHMGFTPCLADPDLWMMAMERLDSTQYWECALLYA